MTETREAFRATLMQLASRPAGFSATEIADKRESRAAWAACERMVRDGTLHRVKYSPRDIRYYSDKRVADTLQPTAKPAIVLKPREKARWDPDEPGIITDKTVFTQCPSPKAFHVKQLSRW